MTVFDSYVKIFDDYVETEGMTEDELLKITKNAIDKENLYYPVRLETHEIMNFLDFAQDYYPGFYKKYKLLLVFKKFEQ